MKLVFMVSAAILGLSVATATAAPCGPGHRRHCPVADTTVDFSAVPDISKQIVAEEPAPLPIKPAVEVKPAAPYSGPTVGIAPLPRAPTVGYKWSLQ